MHKKKPGKDEFEYYPLDMDRDLVPLCDALNEFPGVRTFYSCSGHGRNADEFYVSMGVSNIRSLKKILACFDVYDHLSKMPEGADFYSVEVDGSFWPLKTKEINLRVSNRWVSGLQEKERARELKRVARLLKKELAK